MLIFLPQLHNDFRTRTRKLCERERCGNIVENRLLEQWFYRITAYAEKLLGNSFSLGWLEKVKVFQQDLIGKKEGITITYPVVDGKDLQFEEILFVVTRLNTDFGATFVVLAPENPVINRLLEVIEPKQRAKIIKYMSTKSN